LKEEVLDHNKWRNRFGGGCGLSSDRLLMMMICKKTVDTVLRVIHAPPVFCHVIKEEYIHVHMCVCVPYNMNDRFYH
jgi:hypothetical protein